MAIHVAYLVLCNTLLREWQWGHHTVNPSVEMASGIVAILLVVSLLISLCRRYAEVHGGTPGESSTFRGTLPLAKRSERE